MQQTIYMPTTRHTTCRCQTKAAAQATRDMLARLIAVAGMLLLFAMSSAAQIKIGGNIYGGGNKGNLEGNTKVTIYSGNLDKVFGGARMADVGGNTFVNIDGEHASNYVLINYVYAGNDIAGEIGKGASDKKAIPEELNQTAENGIDNTWDAYLRISTKLTTEGEGEEAVTREADDARKVYIGQLFGGGNGDYVYPEERNADGDYEVRSADNTTVVATSSAAFDKPELAKTYIEMLGGSVVYAYGGGNNVTVTEKTVICVDNPSKVVSSITDHGEELLTAERTANKMGINPGYSYPTSDEYQVGRLFGGNNKAEMTIRPTWNLKSGKVRNIYSGGNRGRMTSPEGLLLEIPANSTIEAENVYGGCRMADVIPMRNGSKVTAESLNFDSDGNQLYYFPDGFAARLLVRGGRVINVYGGNDITGKVYGGNAVGVYTTVYGDIYGGGNGAYPYTDNPRFASDPTYSDFYYPTGAPYATNIDALNAFRPNSEQVSIRLAGTEKKHTVVHGGIFVGGNCATLVPDPMVARPKAELKIGSYVYGDSVFLGNNGAAMVRYNVEDHANYIHEGVLRTYQDTSLSGDGTAFNSLDLKDDGLFADYMEGVTMSMMPSVVFDSKASGDPDNYVDYTSYFASVYCGGNVGSMRVNEKTTMNFSHRIIVCNKIVGGCNNANVPATAFNAAYNGGLIGTPDADGNKLELNLAGVKIQPKRWKVERDEADYSIKKVDEHGRNIFLTDADGNEILEWNTIYASTNKETAPIETSAGSSTSTDDDIDRRLKGGNVYGGCYNSGRVNGNVIINIDESLVDRNGEYSIFDHVEQDGGEALYEHDSYTITKRTSGVILDEQGMDVLISALSVFGGGYGKDSEIWGSVNINLNAGYTFQIFGGGEQGIIGKPNDPENSGSMSYSFNGKTYYYNPNYSCYINIHNAHYPGVARGAAGDNAEMAEAEFVYGGGFEGPILGNTIINFGNGRVFNTFAGSCNADILGHTETYLGRASNNDSDHGFPYIRDHIFGGNDLGGQIFGQKNFYSRMSDNAKTKIYSPVEPADASAPELTSASAYIEYLQGRVLNIYGGCYGDYDYKDRHFEKYTNDDGTAKAGFIKPRMQSAFVNFKPLTQANSSASRIYGAGRGNTDKTNNQGDQDRDIMQERSYILVDIPQAMTNFHELQTFGSGDFCGLGMGIDYTTAQTNSNGITGAAVTDLVSGQINNVFGASCNAGVTRRTIVNVPKGSTIEANNIFGGGFGFDTYFACDAYEATVNYYSNDAQIAGAIYGGNNSERRTVYSKINIGSTVWSDKANQYYSTVYGAGYGTATWVEYSEVNLEAGAKVYQVYGGGQAGKVHNAESIQRYMNAYKPATWPEGSAKAGAVFTDEDWRNAWTLGKGYDPEPFTFGPAETCYINNERTNLNSHLVRTAEMDDRKEKTYRYNANVLIKEGALVSNYAYGGGLGAEAVVAGTTYIALLGGKVTKDIYAAGTSGAVEDLHGARNFTASANIYIKGGSARNVYGGGWEGAVGHHAGEEHTLPDGTKYTDYLTASTVGDIPGETHVIIGDLDGTSYINGIPAIERNAYGGGEGGAVWGTANITFNKGYIGYRYFSSEPEDAETYAVISDGGGYYQEKIVDETWKDTNGNYIPNTNLKDSGCLFGGGYIDNSSVDVTNVKMFNGHVRNGLFGGGEIAAIGRGVIIASGENNSHRELEGIYKAGRTNVTLYSGYVHRNVFGGGRGYNNLGAGGTLYSDGYVFGQTRVNIYGGEVGSQEEISNDIGNVFGGGDIGYVYSAYEDESGNLCFGKKDGVRYDNGSEGHYFRSLNGEFVLDAGEKVLTEDCKVLVEPWCKVNDGVEKLTINGHDYKSGEYVNTDDLNMLGNKNSSEEWSSLDPTGIIIHNAVFAGGNTSSGSATVYANATSIFGNATASIHDIYHRDLITIGTGHTGGLYGDGNLTFVDGYRGLNITNYGTDYYTIAKEINIDQYHALPEREAAYYELRYKCIKTCVDKDGTRYNPETEDGEGGKTAASTISADDLLTLFTGISDDGVDILRPDGTPNPDYWTENGVCSRYAGRIMNTIQRADFCGVFGSRMVMQGAQDRVPEVVDYTNYTINRVREVSLNKKLSKISSDAETDRAMHGNYFGIFSIVNYLGALTSDVDFGDESGSGEHNDVGTGDTRTTDNIDKESYNPEYEGQTFYGWKKSHINNRKRNNGNSHNQVALASGVYLELTTEESTGDGLYEKVWGTITGVIELDLINVQTGIGGGFVYARNEHGVRTKRNLHHATLTALNEGAVTKANFTYSDDDATKKEWQTSGNFVHSSQTIIDDCYNISGKYKTKYKEPDGVPAHYWYIKGSVYVYDQYISAYTGAPNAYSETVDIPLTITAASHSTMKLLNVMPNLYAYYSAPGVPLEPGKRMIINEVSYYKNDPISYWDWYLLSKSEKELFVDETYVTIADCKVGDEEYAEGTVMLPSDYQALKASAPKKQLEGEDSEAVAYATQIKDVEGEIITEDVDFDFVFRSSNNLGHDTGYILTYKVNNPALWDSWYTLYDSDTHEKSQTPFAEPYNNGPTYRLKGKNGGLLGQLYYDEGNVISESVYDTYQSVVTHHPAAIPTSDSSSPDYDENLVQAEFEKAYILTEKVEVKEDDGATHHLNPGATISESFMNEKNLSANCEGALICTSTIQLSSTEYIYLNSKLSATEKANHIKDVSDKIRELVPTDAISDADLAKITKLADLTEEQLNAISADKLRTLANLLLLRSELDTHIVPAYYCISAGLYGGNYYESGHNYRALEAFSSMSPSDRKKFTFNYDALDLLIDPSYSHETAADGTKITRFAEGQKYQYDSEEATPEGAEANKAQYSLETKVNYTATFTGTEPLTYTDENNVEHTIAVGAPDLSREEYDMIPNERRHYTSVNVSEPGTYYVVSTTFQIGNTPYAIGTTISENTYHSLGESDQNNVTAIEFTEADIAANNDSPLFYYCRESYYVNQRGMGQSVTGIKDNTNTYGDGDGDNDHVPIGLIISEENYNKLVNKQASNFIIHGIAPTETSTLFVSRYSDIFDLSKDKIITVIYQYDYEEADASGNITPVSERHVLNIHLQFKSGVPSVEDIRAPQIILPGDFLALREPNVTPGAYEVTGGGWELFESIEDAENHSNGVEYSPNFDPLYWYQHGHYVAYYAKTYLGKTYSNHVPVSVANYHDLKNVLADKEHHYYVDLPYVPRDSKIYINDYSRSGENGLDLLKNFYDLSLLDSSSDGVADDKVTTGQLSGHALLDSHVKQGDNLDFILRTDIDHSEAWTPIASADDECFAGRLHGDGHALTGLDHSLFGHLCGRVYNLGVTGSFKGGGIAEEGSGRIENSWVMSSSEPDEGTKAVFNKPDDDGQPHVINSYYAPLAYTGSYGAPDKDSPHTPYAEGPARPMSLRDFYNGTVAYNLNGFYLNKHYADNTTPAGTTTPYAYFTTNEDGTLQLNSGSYGDNIANSSTGHNGETYVEDRYRYSDFIYAGGTIPEGINERLYTNPVTKTTTYYPIWPDDYIYFGQLLTYGWAAQAHQDQPTAIAKSNGRLRHDVNSNRVYRAPAYYRSSEMSFAHFNSRANFAAYANTATLPDGSKKPAYPDMTAIDFTGYNDVVNGYKAGLNGNHFYEPLLDYEGLVSFANRDETRNLLVYADADNDQATHTLLYDSALPEATYTFNESTVYNEVARPANASTVNGHLVSLITVSDKAGASRRGTAGKRGATRREAASRQFIATNNHYLVDEQDFWCPIPYSFDNSHRMWYQRRPSTYVSTEWSSDVTPVRTTTGWEGISLPFTAAMVSTQTKGELTHFYNILSGSGDTDRAGKVGHEYWLREYRDIESMKSSSEPSEQAEALFTYPDAAAGYADKVYSNPFLWDYYYSQLDQHDANTDTYQQYYNSEHTYHNYPLIEKGAPYIIGFPGSTYYEFDLSGQFKPSDTADDSHFNSLGSQIVSFVSETATTIQKTDDDIAAGKQTFNGYTFMPSYLSETFTAGDSHYVMNALGSAYDQVADNAKTKPFRPYFAKSGGESRSVRRIVFKGEHDSPEVSPEEDQSGLGELLVGSRRHKIVVTSTLPQTTAVRIVTVGGATIATFAIDPGETIETNVQTSGIYLVNNKKIAVR